MPGSYLLRAAMWSRYSHSALYDDETGFVYDSTLLQGGVRRHTKAEFDKHYRPDWQELREVPVVASVVLDARKWLEEQVGKDYDWTALVGFLVRRDWSEESDWFCSEMTEAFRSLFSQRRFLMDLWRITPHHQYIIAR